MLSAFLINLTTLFYFAGMVLFFIFMAVRRPLLSRLAHLAAGSGFILLSFGLALRWYESYQILGEAGHAPLSNFYESMVFFSWTILLVYFFINIRYRRSNLGILVLPLAFFTIIGAQLLSDDAIEPLVPALQSNWLTYHVLTCFLGYAAFAVACCAAIMYLIKTAGMDKESSTARKKYSDIFPSAQVLDEINYQAVLAGFPLLSLGIITGSAWAYRAWGSYWSWDPKETWSLIVWLIYAAFLHARISRGWTGEKIAWLSVVGFVATLFCYLGVNFLLSGLHSYGSW